VVKKLKTLTILLLIALLLSCSKKVYQERTDDIQPDPSGQEIQNIETTFVFDIDSFKFLDEFPKTIAEIKTMYPDEDFEESISANSWKHPVGDNFYMLKSSNINFVFLGDTIEEAILCIVEIYNTKYQCKSMQVIGMPIEELENASGEKLTRDKTVVIFTPLYGLTISTKDGVVQNYLIIDNT
jgi:hypothetical protein